MNLPAAFQEEMKALLKEDYASYEESFQKNKCPVSSSVS